MSNHKFCFMLAFIFFVSLTTVSCNKSQTRQSGKVKATNSVSVPSRQPAKPWDDWLVLQGDRYVPVVDELGRNFEAARTSFLNTDFRTAARETRKASAFLRDQLATAAKGERNLLKASIRDLNRLARQLDHRSVESLARLDGVFVRAQQVDMERNWTVVGFERWNRATRAPEAHLRLAEQALLKKDYDSAAREIHKAAGLLKLEATRATVDGKTALNTSWQELNKLAAAVQSGSVKSVQRLNSPFAAAGYALAESHYFNAVQDWTRNEFKESGHELNASVLSLTEGAEWAGHGAEFDSSLVVKDAMELSRKLIEGEFQTAGQIAPEVHSVGSEIEHLKKEIKHKLDLEEAGAVRRG